MVRKIIWSKRAQTDRRSIFTFWNSKNKSQRYSKRLNQLFVDSLELIALHPQIGSYTERENVRVKHINHFSIIYEVDPKKILVLAIFDTRQNPDKFDKIIDS